MEWITDRVPENNHDVLVSVKFDEQVRMGFYVEESTDNYTSRSWYVFEGENLERYGPSYIDGWMPLPKAIYDYAADLAKAQGGE